VLPGSAAEQAGLIPTRRDDAGEVLLGDVITSIDGKPVRAVEDLFATMKGCKVGQTVVVELTRDTQRMQKKVTLGAID